MKKTLKRLSSGTFVYGFGSILQSSLAFFLLPLYTRFLSAEEFGMLSVLSSIGSFCAEIFLMGLGASVTRYYFKYKNNEEELENFLSSVFNFLIFSNLFFTVSIFLLGEWFFKILTPDINFRPYILITIWQTALFIFFTFYLQLLRAKEEARKFIFLKISKFLISTFLIIFFIAFLKWGVLGNVYGQFFASLIFFIVIILINIKQGNFKQHFNFNYVKKALIYGLPLIPHALAGWAVSHSDRLILSGITNVTQTGIYDLGYKIAMGIALVTSAINYAWSPIFFDTADNEPDAKKIFSDIFNVYIFGLCTLSLGLTYFSRDLIHFIGTSEYYSAYKIVPFIVLGYVFQGIYFMRVAPIFYKEKTKLLSLITPISAVINISLNFVLINWLGMFGSGIAFMTSFLFNALVVHIVSQKTYHIPYSYKKIAPTFVVFLILIALSPFVNRFNLVTSFILKIFLVGIFINSAFIFKTITIKQIMRSYEILRTKISSYSVNLK